MKKILIINSAPFTEDFVKPITELFDKDQTPYTLVSFGEIPEDKTNISGIIISASPKGDDILTSQRPFYQWLEHCNIPVIGSCHGHQMMAVVFGSQVMINKEVEEGIHVVTTIKNDSLFKNLPNTFEVEQHHIKSVTLTRHFELLASSEKCKVQIMKHKERPLYGLQFHIESNPTLIRNFVSICKNI